MGRRSTNTTKSGKFMNPTDQARKQARKRELKKNKKQRKLVRETVLKLKDPTQILDELLRLDLMEIDAVESEEVNEKVLADKKKKLQITLYRILGLYSKTDRDKYLEIKRYQTECDRKRHRAYLIYQTQKMSEQNIDKKKSEDETPFSLTDVELPYSGSFALHEIPMPGPIMPGTQSQPYIPNSNKGIPQVAGLPPGLIPPGPPPGYPPPPSPDGSDDEEEMIRRKSQVETDVIAELERLENEFHDMEADEDYDSDNGDERLQKDNRSLRRRKVRFEDEKSEEEKKDGQLTMQQRLLQMAGHDPNQTSDSIQPLMPPGPPPGNPRMLPPGPPPGRPPGPPPGLPPMGMSSTRMPNLPPLPPSARAPFIGRAPTMYSRQPSGPQTVFEKGPEIKSIAERDVDLGTISAEPKLRNIRAEVTKFIPTAVKLRRNPSVPAKQKLKVKPFNEIRTDAKIATGPTKDDVYAKFMDEMTGFL